MKKDILNEIFEALSGVGVVSTEGEFSQDWLGYSESYLRTLRFKNAEPSMGVLAICASRLQKAGEEIMSSPRHRHVGQHFIELSERCHKLVNDDAIELELVG